MGPWLRTIVPFMLITSLFLNCAFLINTGAITLPTLLADDRTVGYQYAQLDLHPSYPAHGSSPAHVSSVSSRPESVALAMVMYGEISAMEGLLALKTALMHISRPVEFHIVCSPDAASIIESKLALFSRPSYSINVKFYPISEASIKDRATRAGVASGSRHGAGYAGIIKAFLHEVLYDVEKIIYFDTDMLFLVDPYLLWREFDRYSSRNEDFLVSFPTLGEKSTSDVVCSCIMLLNLEAMRKKHFMPSTFFPPGVVTLGSPETWTRAGSSPFNLQRPTLLTPQLGIDPQNPQFADQDLYFAIWKRFGREMFENLSVAWDTTHCRFSYGLSLADGNDSITESEQIARQDSLRGTKMYDEFDQLYPAVLHFNCQPDAAIAWDDPLNSNRPRWGPFVKVAKAYKWVWLNRGDGSVGVRTEHIGERPFWDELTYAS